MRNGRRTHDAGDHPILRHRRPLAWLGADSSRFAPSRLCRGCVRRYTYASTPTRRGNLRALRRDTADATRYRRIAHLIPSTGR